MVLLWLLYFPALFLINCKQLFFIILLIGLFFFQEDKLKARGTHTPIHGLASTSRMRTAIIRAHQLIIRV